MGKKEEEEEKEKVEHVKEKVKRQGGSGVVMGPGDERDGILALGRRWAVAAAEAEKKNEAEFFGRRKG